MKARSKRICLVILAVMMAAAMVVTLSGCGDRQSESKTKAKFGNMDSESGIHFKGGMDSDGKETIVDMYMKDDNIYMESEVAGEKSIVIVKDDSATVLSEKTKTGMVVDMTDELQTAIDQVKQLPEGVEQIASASDVNYTEGKKKIDGKEYETETAKYQEQTATFAYDDKGELNYIIYGDGSTDTTIRVYALESGVDDKMFEVPDGYTVKK